MDVGSELRHARKRQGLTVRELAKLGSTSAAAISQLENGQRGVSVERLNSLLLKTRHRIVTVPTIAHTVSEVADTILGFISSDDSQAAYRELISLSDSLRKEALGVRVALTLSAPASTGSELYDAAISAMTEYWLNQDSLPLPAWINDETGFLKEPIHLREGVYGVVPDRDDVPEEFWRRGVIFPASALQSV